MPNVPTHGLGTMKGESGNDIIGNLASGHGAKMPLFRSRIENNRHLQEV